MFTPWKKIDRLKGFFFHSLQFLMRTNYIPESDLTTIDNSPIPLLKKAVDRPPNAENVYGSKDDVSFWYSVDRGRF